MLEWWERYKVFFEEWLNHILYTFSTNWFKHIKFGTKEDFFNAVIDRLWDEYAYEYRVFVNSLTINSHKEKLKSVLLKKLSYYYENYDNIL
tara:strand:- start:2530 stop:2802 length:273 start_codon:yes stop_codon:yes gene_type:complete